MIRSLSISGLLTLNLHSLNNEGTEGNVQMTRMVKVVDAEGRIENVNAISGDMFKHAQCDYYRQVATEIKLTLCKPSAQGDANRINKDDEFQTFLKNGGKKERRPGSEVIKYILEHCALTDCEGTLVVAEGYSVPRKSCVEFGWIVGRPSSTRTDSFLHVRYDPEGRGKSTAQEETTGQALFHRPASSGQYAVTVHVEFDRVGRNDIDHSTIDQAERRRRMLALAHSLTFTFVQPRGAQRNTQAPHVLAFEGVITTSTASVPAPAISALSSSYREQIEKITRGLNAPARDRVQLQPFADMAGFVEQMNAISATLETK
jgi:CRISPR-associated protein Cst2